MSTPTPTDRTAQSLIADYQRSKEALEQFKRTTFPIRSHVWVKTPQYTGPGTVTFATDCAPHRLAVMLENGNTWFYPLECCQPHPKES